MSSERQQVDISGSESSPGGHQETELDGGRLENIELASEDKRQQIRVKLASGCCEMALTLVYSDRSTQLREITADAKVDSLL